MDILEEVLQSVGALDAGWEVEGGMGMDALLICPCGHTIEQDGQCPDGCISPLRTNGLI